MSKTFQRFSKLLDAIENSGAHLEDPKARLISYLQNDARGSVFRIQALFKLYRQHKRFGEKFEKGWKKSKDFEDLLGAYNDSSAFFNKAQTLKLEPTTLLVIEKRVKKDREQIINFMDQDWPLGQEKSWKDKYEERFILVAEQDQERTFILKQMASFIQEFQKREYDLKEIQKGIHEFRRKLRWIILMLQASGGLFVLDNDPELEKHFEKYVNGTGASSSPFSQIPILAKEKDPIAFPRPLFEMLVAAVFKIGEAKDWGELQENLSWAFLESGLEEKLAHKKSVEIALGQPGYADPFALAQKWKDTLEKENILGLTIQKLS